MIEEFIKNELETTNFNHSKRIEKIAEIVQKNKLNFIILLFILRKMENTNNLLKNLTISYIIEKQIFYNFFILMIIAIEPLAKYFQA